MSLVKEQAAFLLDACKLIQHATDLGFTVTGGELYRTPEQQKLYVDSGRSKTLNSNHLKRLAIDLNFIRDGKLVYDMEMLRPLGEYWQGLSTANRWGGFFKSFKDMPHFERNLP